MRQTEILVIGQGISGSWLAWYLEQSGISFHIIDRPNRSSASAAAAGIINPVTGRRIVTTWMINELMPFAETAYRSMGDALQCELITETDTIDFFPTVQMLQAFRERYDQDKAYLSLPADEHAFRNFFRYELGYGIIRPCFLIDVNELICACRRRWQERAWLTENHFERDKLQVTEGNVEYEDIVAKQVIYCDGVASATDPRFQLLPFAPNKGELLLVEINGLPRDHIYKMGMSIVPWQNNLFWVGSSYEWTFSDQLPSAAFRQRTDALLNNWLKIPYRIVDHLAAIRPATLERRPFAGFHPLYPNVGIFNGMGTKGCSLAPWFAQQFVKQLLGRGTLDPLVDIKRFDKILRRG